MMIELATTALLFLSFLAFAAKRGLTYMHVYQQEEYDSERLLSWIWKNKAFDKRLSVVVIVVTILSFFIPPVFVNFLIFTAMAFATYREKDPRKDSKKKLVATARAKRIFFPAYFLSVLAATWCFLPVTPMPWLWILNIHLIPFMILFVNMMLAPFEEMNQKKFWNEAHNKVLDYQPTVIGITGSFGKTSVKHILGHILKTQAPTLVTPGSVNTPMGISRILREQLEPEHKYLIVEMGAYGRGSIDRLCRLTPPDFGIITSIGHAHYERFKSLETVAETKYELAEAVVGRGGQVVVHERTLRFDYTRAMKEQNENHFIVCGESADVDKSKQADKSYLKKGDLEIHKIIQGGKGLEVRFTWKNVTYNVEVPLFGIHHGHNIALAFVTAFELGVSSKDIQTALQSLPQIEHRLEVRKQSGGLTIIDDAYNSNPMGFQSALGLLSQIGSSKRKILITPGMVELGKIHDEAHKSIGAYAGEVCDIAIVVKGKRIPTFITAFKETGASKQLHEVESFDEAQKWIAKNKQDGDVVLIENDLPDIYERVPRI
ncbi:MAG: UDP-N-acetylmuramoyl-tripeptide--D-alanyl-D-alanine ligase [Rhodospirillales bacterium]|nr:UDP-N-acetylmuramoyl-tripeptide--D-alanyl-D-alanine ligase [Alphaproteobacteria bacterium]MCB9981878.1 UDP-N-acetylmuramoyl-tripeptide--D-alanyl-D-alanine ligase [Rhodospirillales bacterium]